MVRHSHTVRVSRQHRSCAFTTFTTRHGTHQEELLPPTPSLSPLIHLPPSPFPSTFLQLLIAAAPPPRPTSRRAPAFCGVQAPGEWRVDHRGAANRLLDLGLGGRRREFEADAEGSVPSVEPLRGALGPRGLGVGEVGARGFRDQGAALCEIRKCENGG